MNKVEILPAILPKTFYELEEKALLVKDLVKAIQIDICDGQFVPNVTWPYKKEDDSFERILHEEQGLPGWEKLDFEIDLMVNSPAEVVEEWVVAGASRIILHAEARGDVMKAVEILHGRVEIGLAFAVESDPVSFLKTVKEKGFNVNSAQLMGIDRVGFQRQEFDPKVIEKIKEVKAAFPDLTISVDGAVSLETAPQLIEAGATRLIVGSAIFEADNFTEAIREFKAVGYR
jgi:ribulose-phosphate 3-epimerase